MSSSVDTASISSLADAPGHHPQSDAGSQHLDWQGDVRDRPDIRGVAGVHRGVCAVVLGRAPCDPRRLSAFDGVRAFGGQGWPSACVPRVRLDIRHRGVRHRALPAGVRRRSHSSRRRSQHLRHRRRQHRHRPGVRGLAADHGNRPAVDLRRLRPLRAVRPIPARAVEPSRFRLRAGGRPVLHGNGGHLRHADLCVGDLHLPLHRVLELPRARRDHPPCSPMSPSACSATPAAVRPRWRWFPRR